MHILVIGAGVIGSVFAAWFQAAGQHFTLLARGQRLIDLQLREGQSLRLRNRHDHTRSVGFPPNHPPMESFLGVPITRKGQRLDNLYLTDKRSRHEFTDDDQHLIELLAAHAEAAIENARL